MTRLPDGPLGPKLIAEGFERLGDLGETSYRNSPRLTAEERFAVGAACSSIAIRRYRLPELPIFVNIGGIVTITVFVDVRGQIWFAREIIDLSTWGVDDLVKLE